MFKKFLPEILAIVAILILSYLFHTVLPDGLSSWILTTLFGLLLLIVAWIGFATLAPTKPWIENLKTKPLVDAIFHGLLGHAIVAITAVIVAAGVYERLDTPYRKAKICVPTSTTQMLDKVIYGPNGTRNPPVLVHVRDGIGQAKNGQPLLVEWIRMTAVSGQYCAEVKYPARFGFQFKIFVELRNKPTKEELKILSDDFAKEALVEGGPSSSDVYATIDHEPEKNGWRLWILIKDFQLYKENLPLVPGGEQEIWNNFFPPSDKQ